MNNTNLVEKYHTVLQSVHQTINQNIDTSKLPSPFGFSLPFFSSSPITLSQRPTSSWPYTLPVGAILLYALACRILRYRARDRIHKKYNYPTRESFSKMTNDDAQAIGQFLGEMEFPYFYVTALSFGLFKTYAIPTISKLLVDTKQLSTAKNASKRYADTAVMIDEIVGNPPTSTRCIKTISRLNYLHSNYPSILNSDFLFTLAQFIVCPIHFINTYEWRDLTPLEICAISTLWKGIGDGMGIKYDELRRAKTGWKDGIEFYEDLMEWAEDYERKFMVPAATNRVTADETVKLLLWLVPRFLHPYVRNVLCVMMGDRVRTAMMFQNPPRIYSTLTTTILTTRRLLLRHLSPPRPSFLRNITIAPEPNLQTNRYNYTPYQAHPFYVKPTFWNRWGPKAWLVWAFGGAVPGSKKLLAEGGDEYFEPPGYSLENLGPVRLRGKGRDRVGMFEEKLRRERLGGCPFGVVN